MLTGAVESGRSTRNIRSRRADLGGDHERRDLGAEPPRTGGESVDLEAARFPRLLLREGVAVERVNFAGKEGAATEEVQHQGA